MHRGERRQEEKFREKVFEEKSQKKIQFQTAEFMTVLSRWWQSRGLARKLQEDVAFWVLAAENFPSHRTLCEFRRRHLGDFKRMFVQVVRLAAETGVANFGKLSTAIKTKFPRSRIIRPDENRPTTHAPSFRDAKRIGD